MSIILIHELSIYKFIQCGIPNAIGTASAVSLYEGLNSAVALLKGSAGPVIYVGILYIHTHIVSGKKYSTTTKLSCITVLFTVSAQLWLRFYTLRRDLEEIS